MVYLSVPVLQSGIKVYRYNQERTLQWLKTKVSSDAIVCHSLQNVPLVSYISILLCNNL